MSAPTLALAPPPLTRPRGIEAVLAERRPALGDMEASFVALEQRAHRLLPQLAAIRRAIGSTPMVPVPSLTGRGTVWLKMEAANLTGTVKARTAYALLCAAVARAGTADLRLVEYSGGSLALALAKMCELTGIDLHLAVPHHSPGHLVDTLRAHGAQVSHGRPGTGFAGAMNEAVRVAETQGRHLLLQHCAPEAVAVHREHTGAEIVSRLVQEGVSPLGMAAAVGSAGTLVGAYQALHTRWPGSRAIAVFPAEAPYGDERAPSATPRMNGTGGLGHGLRQPLLAPYENDVDFARITYGQALKAMRLLRHTQHITVSSSAAGAYLAASRLVDEGPRLGHAVAIAAGRGTSEEWARADQL